MKLSPAVCAFVFTLSFVGCHAAPSPLGQTSDGFVSDAATAGDGPGSGLGALEVDFVADSNQKPDDVSDSGAATPADAGVVTPDAATTSTPDSGSDAAVNSDEAIDSVSEIDCCEGDASAPLDSDSSSGSDTEPDAPKPWTVNGGCAQPEVLPPSPECLAAACAPDEICVGSGYCVLDGPFGLPVAASHSVVEGLAVQPDGSWALNMRTGGPGQWDVRLVAFATPKPNPAFVLDVPSAPGIWNDRSVAAPLADGGWLLCGMQLAVATGDISYWSWPVAAGGALDPKGPYQLSQNKLNQNGKVYTGYLEPSLVPLRDGNFLVAWDGSTGGPKTDAVSVRIRYLNKDGVPIGTEHIVAPPVWPAMAWAPSLAPLDDGAALLLWAGNGKKGTKTQVRGSVLAPLAASAGAVLDVSPSSLPLEFMPSIATWPDGTAIAAWKAGANPANACPLHVMVQRLTGLPPAISGKLHELDYDAEGTKVFRTALAPLDNQRAVAVWNNADPKMESIYFGRYYRAEDIVDCAKTDVAGPPEPNELPARTNPAVAALGNGSFLVAWSTDIPIVPGEPNMTIRLRYFAY